MLQPTTKEEIERELYTLRVMLERAGDGTRWEQRIIDRIAWLRRKLEGMEQR